MHFPSSMEKSSWLKLGRQMLASIMINNIVKVHLDPLVDFGA
jgi:hypothetical protein